MALKLNVNVKKVIKDLYVIFITVKKLTIVVNMVFIYNYKDSVQKTKKNLNVNVT